MRSRTPNPRPYWLDDPDRPAAQPALVGDETCDLLVVGGGYIGLWTALIAKERDPARDVVLIEAPGDRLGRLRPQRRLLRRLPHPRPRQRPGPLARRTAPRSKSSGIRNLDAIEEAVARYDIDCDFERTGEIDVATEPHQVDELRGAAPRTPPRSAWTGSAFLDRDEVRAEVDSPTFLAGLWDRDGVAMLNPAKLAWGLKRACLGAGRARSTSTPRPPRSPPTAPGMAVRTPYGRVCARHVALGTNVFPSLVKRVRPYIVPVYDYALMTEPLTAEQLAAIGWRNRQGLGDTANHFHYFRITADNRILWGGYDVVYRYGGGMRAEYDHRPGHLREARPALLPLLPAAGGRALHPRLGRRHRHLLPLLRVLRQRARRHGSPTPPATPASASAPPASAPR